MLAYPEWDVNEYNYFQGQIHAKEYLKILSHKLSQGHTTDSTIVVSISQVSNILYVFINYILSK